MKSLRLHPLLLAVLSGLLNWAAWPGSPLTLLIFVSWVPLLLASERTPGSRKFLGLCYTTMLIWNLGTTWWIWNATAPGAIAAWLANSLLMCLPWMAYRWVRKKSTMAIGYLSLIAFWLSFEYLHLQDWGLSWPWLTLGNVFALHPEWVYWYSFFGTAAGSAWVLLVNLMLFHQLRTFPIRKGLLSFQWLTTALVMIAGPILVSQHRLRPRMDAGQHPKEVIIVQPNIDPYQKIADGTSAQQLQQLVALSRSALTPQTRLLVWPETALYHPYGYEEASLSEDERLQPLWQLLREYPQLSLFTGIESYRWVESPTRFSRPAGPGQRSFEAYNGSVLLDHSGVHGFYHKSMLVPGVETLPWFLRFMDRWFEKFGGVTAGYAKQSERKVLSEKNGFAIAPAICYESIYGDFMRQYVKRGANVLTVITNDGWWKNTPGHRQHLHYARLRAIETGCWVIRSANTGISAFIDPRGTLIETRAYDTKATLTLAMDPASSRPTLFVRWGDWLSKIMLLLAALLITRSVLKKTNHGIAIAPTT